MTSAAKEFFHGLTPAAVQRLEAEATADPYVRAKVRAGAPVLMQELLEVLNESEGEPRPVRIMAMTALIEDHCVRGFSLGFGFATAMTEKAEQLAASTITEAARRS